MTISKELLDQIPPASAAVANYRPWLRSRHQIFVSGQIPKIEGLGMIVGRVGKEVDEDEAKKAARWCGLNILAQVRDACGGEFLPDIRCVKLVGFVNADPEFKAHAQIINAASDLMVEAFGERGYHTRSAVGAGSLPYGFTVEIEAIFELDEVHQTGTP